MTSTAYPFTSTFLVLLRSCYLDSEGVLHKRDATPVRCYVLPTTANPGGEWWLTETMTEGGPIDATSLSLMQADPHRVPLVLCLVVSDAGSKAVQASEDPGGGPPDPGYAA